ncbi:protein kinase [Colletotrichum cereale]|nr:protein kinase [Colletotrichum cereale]
MLAPFFSLSEYNHVYHYPLSEHHILPFIEEEKRHSSKSTVNSFNKELDVEGGFSQVFIVWMHPDHHNFHHCELSPKRGFAIKQLKKKDREHFENEPKGVLKITDFGEAKLHTKETRTYRESRGIDTLTYRPPECDIHPYTIRQSSDIWSLGCIFLEFVTWTFGGSKYLEEFTQKRLVRDHDLPRFKSDSFYERIPVLGKKGARRKPAITNQIEELKENPLCTEYFREVLCLIDYMLVVEPSKIFSGQGRRKTCAEVESTLAKAYNQCLENRIYAVGK